MRYPYEHLITVCTGGRCNSEKLHGQERADTIQSVIKRVNADAGHKSKIRVCTVSCLELCETGPNFIDWPSGDVYAHLDSESAARAYLGLSGGGPVATDKLLQPTDIDPEKRTAAKKAAKES